MDPTLHLALRAALAVLLLSAARHKLADRARFRAALAAHQLLPASTVAAAAVAIPVLELALAAALLLPGLGGAPALATAALLAAYTAAVGINLARGRREIDCGCGGPVEAPLGGGLLLRNGALIAAALVAAPAPAARTLVWLDALTIAAAVAAAALLYAAAETARVNAAPLAVLRARLARARR